MSVNCAFLRRNNQSKPLASRIRVIRDFMGQTVSTFNSSSSPFMFGWIEHRNSCRPGRSVVKRMTASRLGSRNTPPIPFPYAVTPALSILVNTPSNIDEPKSWRSGSTLRIEMTVGTPKRSGICFVTNVKSLIVTSIRCSG